MEAYTFFLLGKWFWTLKLGFPVFLAVWCGHVIMFLDEMGVEVCSGSFSNPPYK